MPFNSISKKISVAVFVTLLTIAISGCTLPRGINQSTIMQFIEGKYDLNPQEQLRSLETINTFIEEFTQTFGDRIDISIIAERLAEVDILFVPLEYIQEIVPTADGLLISELGRIVVGESLYFNEGHMESLITHMLMSASSVQNIGSSTALGEMTTAYLSLLIDQEMARDNFFVEMAVFSENFFNHVITTYSFDDILDSYFFDPRVLVEAIDVFWRAEEFASFAELDHELNVKLSAFPNVNLPNFFMMWHERVRHMDSFADLNAEVDRMLAVFPTVETPDFVTTGYQRIRSANSFADLYQIMDESVEAVTRHSQLREMARRFNMERFFFRR